LTLSAASVAQDAVDESLPKPPAKDFTGRPACPVVSVSAGNELVARLEGRETTIRLIGTYVPDRGPEADAARAFTARLLQGESVYLECEPDRPPRGQEERVWAYVYRAPDGLLVNLELVRQGYARVSAAAPFEYRPLLEAYEQAARKLQKGIWAPRGGLPEPEPTTRPAALSSKPSGPQQDAAEDVLVYVTEHGRKYHRKDCQYVRKGARAVTLKEAKARGCSPCSKCKPPE
jgi:endonuclease YncB( thermonuclease family)